jgi:hypothetical protein
MKQLAIALLAAIVLSACEDVVDVKIKKGTSFPVVDAWLTTLPGPQIIRMTQSVAYTSPTPAPVVSGAVITLFDETNGKSYPFTFKDTAYVYQPVNADEVIGVTGHVYRLRVEYQTDVFEATDSIKRVPPIDSVGVTYKTKEENGVPKDGYEGRFYARDIPGDTADYYWIRSFRNTTAVRVMDDYSIDASFEAGLDDGKDFVFPIETGITDYDHPFLKGETVIVQLRSLTYASYNFISQVQNQLDNGGLFSTVLENVPTNLKNVTPGGGKLKLLGWFGASAVSSSQKTIQ